MGRLAAHVLGYVDLDSKGIAGIEKYLDDQGALYTASLAEPETQRRMPARSRSTSACSMRWPMRSPRRSPSSRPRPAAASCSMSTRGEVVALVSLPDFNPNSGKEELHRRPDEQDDERRLRAGLGHQGGDFRHGASTMAWPTSTSRYRCARSRWSSGAHAIHDFHADAPGPDGAGGLHQFLQYRHRARWRSKSGMERHQEFLRRVGLFDRLRHGTAGKRQAAAAARGGAGSSRPRPLSATVLPYSRCKVPRWWRACSMAGD